MREKLAIFGGPKVIPNAFPRYNPYGEEEAQAALKVVQSGVLSKFIGAWHEDFYGGEKVREFEKAWQDFFQVKHAVSVNSATSGLIAALGAVGVEPGDEVIVSPWTMAASATAILVWNAIPVFVDIEQDSFNLDPGLLEKYISPLTKAIVVPDIFGQAAALDEIMKIAGKHKIKVIEDAAQAPGARYKEKYVGTVADIGVFSLNYHKHIHTGEGGVCVTNDDKLAERLQMIRNHAEVVASGKGTQDLSNMIGFNFRLGELEAAMGIEQLKKLPGLAKQKSEAGAILTRELGSLEGIVVPPVRKACSHVYYVFPMYLELEKLPVDRARLAAALEAEGVLGILKGYVNVHQLPMYQKKQAYGKGHFPWSLHQGTVSYEKGICPAAEELHAQSFMGLQLCLYNYDEEEIKLVVAAFKKVWAQLKSLAE